MRHNTAVLSCTTLHVSTGMIAGCTKLCQLPTTAVLCSITVQLLSTVLYIDYNCTERRPLKQDKFVDLVTD